MSLILAVPDGVLLMLLLLAPLLVSSAADLQTRRPHGHYSNRAKSAAKQRQLELMNQDRFGQVEISPEEEANDVAVEANLHGQRRHKGRHKKRRKNKIKSEAVDSDADQQLRKALRANADERRTDWNSLDGPWEAFSLGYQVVLGFCVLLTLGITVVIINWRLRYGGREHKHRLAGSLAPVVRRHSPRSSISTSTKYSTSPSSGGRPLSR